MDGPVDWWWKMNLLDVCVQAGFCQIRSHIICVKLEKNYCSKNVLLANKPDMHMAT